MDIIYPLYYPPLNYYSDSIYQTPSTVDENKNEELASIEKRKKISKSAYIISVIKKDYFIKYGARLLNSVPFVYYIPKDYKGDVYHETCALIGIRVSDWTDLLTDDSLLIRNLRNCKEFGHIQDIHKLTSYHMIESVFKFKNEVKQFDEDDLILLNIEPKGNGHLEKSYPVPRLCIPGGGMERKDLNSFETCAFREYKEETGIDISNVHILITQENMSRKKSREKYNYPHTPSPSSKSYYTNYYNNHFIQKKDLRKSQENKIYVSMIYLVKIVSEEEKMLYDLETGQLSLLPPPGMFFN
jgi:ADP-ribose pyrophosphatase YjhB (NUDIX family)